MLSPGHRATSTYHILAGIEYVDEDSRYADFHPLRVSYVTAVVRSETSVKEAQRRGAARGPEFVRMYVKASWDDLGGRWTQYRRLPADTNLQAGAKAIKNRGAEGLAREELMTPNSLPTSAEACYLPESRGSR